MRRASRSAKGYKSDTDLTGRRPQGALRAVQGEGQGSARQGRSRTTRASSSGAASARCSSRWNGKRAVSLPPHRGHPRRVGHRGQRPGDGLRQHGRHLGHRRGLHPQPGHRREQVLRRVAGQRPGRGRGGRHPHARTRSTRRPRASRTSTCRRSRRRCPRSTSELDGIRDEAREALPRHAGHRVHHPGGPALDAAVPRRQAQRPGRRQHGRGHGRREADRPRKTAVMRVDAGAARRAAAPDRRPGGREGRRSRSPRACPAGPGGAAGQIVFTAADAVDVGQAGQEGHPRPRRDQPRGRRRHARGAGHPDRPRRHDQPRGARRPRLGQVLHRRLPARSQVDVGTRSACTSAARVSAKATGSPSTAPRATSTPASCR